MKTVIDPKDHKTSLKEWRGSSANIWAFHISFKRMAINLTRGSDFESLYILGVGCEHFTGPIRWDNAEISITTGSPNHLGQVHSHIIDENAGLDIRCLDVVIICGTSSAPIDPFEGFIDGSNSILVQ